MNENYTWNIATSIEYMNEMGVEFPLAENLFQNSGRKPKIFQTNGEAWVLRWGVSNVWYIS